MLDDNFKINYKAIPLAAHINTDNQNNTALHNHYEFEILLICEGSSLVKINDVLYPVKKGDMVFVNPFEIHSVTVNSGSPYSHKCICFDYTLIIDRRITEAFKTKNLHIAPVITAEHEAQPFLKKCFLNIIELNEVGGDYTDTEIVSYLSLMFARLMKYNLTKKAPPITGNTAFCATVLAYVKSHYQENITSGQLAEAISHNHSYFCRKFAKNFGQSFSEYLTEYRISASKKYLEEGGKNISQIALMCGFNSHTYFSKCFKKYVGILPSEYCSHRREKHL